MANEKIAQYFGTGEGLYLFLRGEHDIAFAELCPH
jgi:hypothetical protein